MSQPDILIFLSDQHSGSVMGCAGADIDTPNLDAIAREGVIFDNAYTPCPLCVPARMSFVSGLLPSHTGVYLNADTLSNITPTFLHSMVAAGYETVLIGRMHFVGEDQRHGFMKRLGGEFTPTTWNRPEAKMKEFRGNYAVPVWFASAREGMIGGGESCVTFYDRMITETAVEYLSQPHDKPQCIVVGTYGPHFPYIATPEIYEKYKSRVKLPKDFREFPEELADFMGYRSMHNTEEVAIQAMAAYYAMVEMADGQIGRVRKAFHEMAEREGREKVFFYTSDHGDMLGHKGVYGKNVFFENSARIPLLAEGDGIVAGRRVKDNVSLLDFAPSVCELGGAEKLEEFDGESLLPYLGENAPENRERVVVSEEYDKYIDPKYWEWPMKPEAVKDSVPEYGIMLRQGNWKYIHYERIDGKEVDVLYDMENDSEETVNVALQHPDVVEALREKAKATNNVKALVRQQKTHARNAKLFQVYEKAIDFGIGEMWTDNPPEGRVKPQP